MENSYRIFEAAVIGNPFWWGFVSGVAFTCFVLVLLVCAVLFTANDYEDAKKMEQDVDKNIEDWRC